MDQSRRTAGRLVRKYGLYLVLLLMLAAIVMTPHTLERMFVYFPTRDLEADPSALGLAYENLSLKTEDGITLHGWFVPSESAARTLLIFHGNAGNISHRLEWIQLLHRLGESVLIVDYRGYGRSEGEPFEQGLYRDADAAYAWWRDRRSPGGEKLILVGESLGGAVAVNLASRAPVDGLVLQSTFTSARDMARTILPIGLLQPLVGIHFDSEASIAGISCPKLFIHGNRDEIVPFRMGRALFETASPPKEFYEVDGAGHNDLLWVAGANYEVRLRAYLSGIGPGSPK